MPAMTTVSSTRLVDAGGNVIANATISFQPVAVPAVGAPFPTSFVIGGGTLASDMPVSAVVANGAFSLALADTAQTTPPHIAYAVTCVDNISGKDLLGPGWGTFQPTGGTVAFDQTPPNLITSTTVATQGPPGPAGANGLNGTVVGNAGVLYNGTNNFLTRYIGSGTAVGDASDVSSSATFTGNTTAGSKVITGVSSTAGLLVGQHCWVNGSRSTSIIQAVGSGTVTLSAPAAATASGVSVVVLLPMYGFGDHVVQFVPVSYGNENDPASYEMTIIGQNDNANVLAIFNASDPRTNATGRADSVIVFRGMDATGPYAGNVREHVALGVTSKNHADEFTPGNITTGFLEISDDYNNAPPFRFVRTNSANASGSSYCFLEFSKEGVPPEFGGIPGGINFYGKQPGDMLALVARNGSTACMEFFNDTSSTTKIGGIGVAASVDNNAFANNVLFLASDNGPVLIHGGTQIALLVNTTYNNTPQVVVTQTAVTAAVPIVSNPTGTTAAANLLPGSGLNLMENNGSVDCYTVCASPAQFDSGNFGNTRSRGTLAAPAAVIAGDRLGSIAFNAYDGSNVNYGCQVAGFVENGVTVAAGSVPTKLSFITNQMERAVIHATGGLTVGDITFNESQRPPSGVVSAESAFWLKDTTNGHTYSLTMVNGVLTTTLVS